MSEKVETKNQGDRQSHRQHWHSEKERAPCRATVVKAADSVLRGAAVGSSPDQFCSKVQVFVLSETYFFSPPADSGSCPMSF